MTVTTHRIALATATISAAIIAAGCMPPDRTSANIHSAVSTAPSSATPIPRAAPPVPADFIIGVIVTEQKCFGTAGCNYRYTINPQYVSAKPLPDKTTVVFKVTGGDQDQIGNFSIDADGTATFDRETGISGPEGADLRATVTQVVPGRGAR